MSHITDLLNKFDESSGDALQNIESVATHVADFLRQDDDDMPSNDEGIEVLEDGAAVVATSGDIEDGRCRTLLHGAIRVEDGSKQSQHPDDNKDQQIEASTSAGSTKSLTFAEEGDVRSNNSAVTCEVIPPKTSLSLQPPPTTTMVTEAPMRSHSTASASSSNSSRRSASNTARQQHLERLRDAAEVAESTETVATGVANLNKHDVQQQAANQDATSPPESKVPVFRAARVEIDQGDIPRAAPTSSPTHSEKDVEKDGADPHLLRLSTASNYNGKPKPPTVLSFENIEYVVKVNNGFRFASGAFPTEGSEQPTTTYKHILSDISCDMTDGHVMAIMGPSGAGKTTLISVLTMDSILSGGTAYGKIALNGEPLTVDLFRKHCYVVKQSDKHWPYFTAQEALAYAAQLYNNDDPLAVTKMIEKMGLARCANTRCSRLSGGQQRRLSLAIGLLKRPSVMFLDEPTSGLDAASSSSIMAEIVKVAKEERVIILCTIHQPSTKVYNSFDQLMLLSHGREAFTGNVQDTVPYFESIGYPLPQATNPAEHFLDLINSDFSGKRQVRSILYEWSQEKGALIGVDLKAKKSLKGKSVLDDEFYNTLANANANVNSSHLSAENESGGAAAVPAPSHPATAISYNNLTLSQQTAIMFRRQFALMTRDPICYIGRCVVFLSSNTVFALVYWNARENVLDQIFAKFWLQLWFSAVPCNMGVVAVYALNDEFKSVQREIQNGMMHPLAYIIAKSLLVVPVLVIFALFALILPAFVIQGVPWSAFPPVFAFFFVIMALFESLAEVLSVAFTNPILGMLGFMSFWFGSFLFGGFLINEEDLHWPHKALYYVMPFSYYTRSVTHAVFVRLDWDTEAGVDSTEAFEAIHDVFPLVKEEDTFVVDLLVLALITLMYKAFYVYLVLGASRKVTTVRERRAA